ncbi:MAG TPA: phosphoadenylyl-sulfate reductase [Tepidisphaeraceae bacterium]|nr:phosphoadenylyl-sulfate reductase [Tepidisphaeraceae bacterium]
MTLAIDNKPDLDAINPMLEASEPGKIVEWAVAQFGNDLVVSSSFGEQAAVMLHMATAVKPDIRIIFVDTGYLFPETYEFMENLRHRFNLNVWTYRTKNDPIAYLRQAGEDNPTWRKDIKACCGVNKNEPFERAFKQLKPKAWLRGTRREQTPERKNFKFINWESRYNCYAISPILNWTSRDVGMYMKKYDLPYHPLVEKGYPSIGCNPLSCTRNVLPGEDPRSGRWAETDKTECGINVDNSLDSANL